MKNNRAILTLCVAFLLLLNMVAGILVKASPAYYGRWVLLTILILIVFGSYGLQTLIWLFLGKRYQLSYVYPLLSVNYVLALFVGMAIFHEPFILQRLVGAMIILCGVTLMSLSRHRDEAVRTGTSA